MKQATTTRAAQLCTRSTDNQAQDRINYNTEMGNIGGHALRGNEHELSLLAVDIDTMVRWGEMDSSAMDALMEEFSDLSTDAILSVKTVDDTSTS